MAKTESDGGPAFPITPADALIPDEAAARTCSMSLRDYFAAAALQAIHGGAADIFTASLVPPEHVPPGEQRTYIDKRITELAGTSYAIADAMLAQRSTRG